MGTLTAARLCEWTDKAAAAYRAVLGTAGSGFGTGDGAADIGDDWGLSARARELETLTLAWQDLDLSNVLGNAARKLTSQAPISALVRGVVYPALTGLDQAASYAGIAGVSTLEALAAHYNTGAGGPYAALLAPDFARLFALAFPLRTLPPGCVYAPAAADLGSRAAGSAFTTGTGIDSEKYAGAARLQAVVAGSSFSGAGGTLTIAGEARTASGSILAGRTWTVAVGGDGTFLPEPSAAGDLCIAVKDITLPAGMTAGSVTVAGLIPLGRIDPPV